MIRVSQSERSIPRILEGLKKLNIPHAMERGVRRKQGGLYSWQPWESDCRDWGLYALAFFIVIIGPLSSILISWYTPPEGWGCRHCAYATVFLLYLISALLDIPFKRHFGWTFWKDLFFCSAILIILGISQ